MRDRCVAWCSHRMASVWPVRGGTGRSSSGKAGRPSRVFLPGRRRTAEALPTKPTLFLRRATHERTRGKPAQVPDLDLFAIPPERHGPFDHVLELPDIFRKLVAKQHRLGAGREALERLAL